MERVLYQEDYYGWLQENAQLIREKRFSEIDVENIVERFDASFRRIFSRRIYHRHTASAHNR
jgi:hypothetical protein